MKKINSLLTMCLLLLAQVAVAQKLNVESMKAVTNDISASQHERKDLNGQACALVKIQLVGSIKRVEGNVIGQVVNRDTEKWVYLTDGTKEMKIIPEDYLPLQVQFADYGIKQVKSKVTYVLTLYDPSQTGDIPVGPMVLTTDGPDELTIENITQHMLGIEGLKVSAKKNAALKAIKAQYPTAVEQKEQQSVMITLDESNGYKKTLLGLPVTAIAKWQNSSGGGLLGGLMGGGIASSLIGGSTIYGLTLPVGHTDKESAMEVATRLIKEFTDKGFQTSEPKSVYKMAAAGSDYALMVGNKKHVFMVSVSSIGVNKYTVQLMSIL